VRTTGKTGSPSGTRRNHLEKGEGVVVAEMREHLRLLRERGVDPYPRRWERTHLSSDIVERFDELAGAEVGLR
jgi:lysyl-tRNA synthetase class II